MPRNRSEPARGQRARFTLPTEGAQYLAIAELVILGPTHYWGVMNKSKLSGISGVVQKMSEKWNCKSVRRIIYSYKSMNLYNIDS
jgi:hypothetical protein